MKGKKLNYMLGMAVALIWALIFYRVFAAIWGNDEDPVFQTRPTVKEEYRDFALALDTSRLTLNYRDPFGKSIQKDTVKHREIFVKTVRSGPAAPTANWSLIKYTGFISNRGSRRTISMLSINGKNVALAEGERSDGVEVLKNLGDSVKVRYNNKVKYLSRNINGL